MLARKIGRRFLHPSYAAKNWQTKMVSPFRRRPFAAEESMPLSPKEEVQRIEAVKKVLDRLLKQPNQTRVELFGSLPINLQLNPNLQHKVLKRLREEEVIQMDNRDVTHITYSIINTDDTRALIASNEEVASLLWPQPKVPELPTHPSDPEPVSEETTAQSPAVLPVTVSEQAAGVADSPSRDDMMAQVLKIQVGMLEMLIKMNDTVNSMAKDMAALKELWK